MAEVTAATLQRYIDFNRIVTDFALLDQLDPRVVSRFAGGYFQSANVAALGDLRTFCRWLAERGTHEAIDGLIEAADAGRLYKPDDGCRLNLAWVAALTIARRDRWPGEDAWLANQIARTTCSTYRQTPTSARRPQRNCSFAIASGPTNLV